MHHHANDRDCLQELNPNDSHNGQIPMITTATLVLLSILRVTFLALYLPIDYIKILESKTQLKEEEIVRIVLSSFNMPTRGVSMFLQALQVFISELFQGSLVVNILINLDKMPIISFIWQFIINYPYKLKRDCKIKFTSNSLCMVMSSLLSSLISLIIIK